MSEIKNPYLVWDMGYSWPVWPEKKDIEYDKFYVNTGSRNGKTKDMLTLVVPEIERVIFHEPATIVFWNDGTKTVVKCMEGEEFDEEKGIAMAFMKKVCGDGYMRKIRRHIPVKISTEEEKNVEN